MSAFRRTATALTLGAATALILPAAAYGHTASTHHSSTHRHAHGGAANGTHLSPAGPQDQVLSSPGDLYGAFSSDSPV